MVSLLIATFECIVQEENRITLCLLHVNNEGEDLKIMLYVKIRL